MSPKPDFFGFCIQLTERNTKQQQRKELLEKIFFVEETLKIMTAFGNTRRWEMKREGNHHISIVTVSENLVSDEIRILFASKGLQLVRF